MLTIGNIDPSLIQPIPQPPSISSPTDPYSEQQNYVVTQPSLMSRTPGSPLAILENLHTETERPDHPSEVQSASSPPTTSPPTIQYPSIYDRRPSVSSTHTGASRHSPSASSAGNDDENKEKGRCPHPDCGRVFKDLKAHMLTHQSERPEKCPIITCEYHTKGFARKYDKNRHTLTHYKGTMVCGFCPGSGSPAEKSFNRADVFKRHLTSVHGVEQTPPNCRKKSSTGNQSHTKASSDATGKCSTCSVTFSNPQDFYEHLDDCVLRVVQQEEPSEVINQQRLAEVDSDEEVKKTMEKHKLVNTAGTDDQMDDHHDDDDCKYDDEAPPTTTIGERSGKGSIQKFSKRNSHNPSRPIQGKNNAITKQSSSTQSIANGGKPRPVVSRRRNNRDFYPHSWGCPSSSMKTKKRVLCVFDGPRRLWKDEMMLDNEFEVRLKLPGGAGDGTNREAYITDLDVETLKRAEGVFSASAEERGPWTDGPSTHLIGQPAMLLPGLASQPEEEVDIDELMMS